MGSKRCIVILMKRIFLDSSVLFAAVNSPTGGSAKLFTFKNITLFVSPLVLAEVERNCRKKLHTYHLDRFFYLVSLCVNLDQQPEECSIKKAQQAIHEKDAVILAEVKQNTCDIVVSLDIKHFFTKEARAFLKPTQIMTPKEVIELFEKDF